MEIVSVDVRVGKILREFIICTAGSDAIAAQKDDILWCLIKQNLVTSPKIPYIIRDRSEFIRISLPATHSASTYNCRAEKALQLNTLFRNFLDEEGQRKIRKHFEKEYRNVFIIFMRSQFRAHPDMKIIDAINLFADEYNLTMDNISIQTLKKYWYRYRVRREIEKTLCPIIY